MTKDIIKRAENGTYYFRANLGYNPETGKQIQKYKSEFKTKRRQRTPPMASCYHRGLSYKYVLLLICFHFLCKFFHCLVLTISKGPSGNTKFLCNISL